MASSAFSGKSPLTVQVQLDREFQSLGAYAKLGEGAARDIFQRGSLEAATILRTTLVEAYTNGVPGLEPLHAFTVQRKGGAQPLFDTGRLARSVEMIIIERGSRVDYLVGFSDPANAAQASVLEFGATLAVTDRMRGYLAANGLPLKESTKYIRIPSRPIFLHSLEKAQKGMREVLLREFEAELARNRLQSRGAGTFWGRLRQRLSNAFR